MARLTVQDARQIAMRNRPWTFRLELQPGMFWYATGRGINEPLEVVTGTIHPAQGQMAALGTWTDLERVVTLLLGQGWQYADTPYIRMSPQSLATIQAGQAAPPPADSVLITPTGYFHVQSGNKQVITQTTAQALVQNGTSITWGV